MLGRSGSYLVNDLLLSALLHNGKVVFLFVQSYAFAYLHSFQEKLEHFPVYIVNFFSEIIKLHLNKFPFILPALQPLTKYPPAPDMRRRFS